MIVGGGHGGFHTANALREAGFTAPITIVDAGAGLPYARPPLSKDYLAGTVGAEQIWFRPESFYAAAGVTLLAGTTVEAVDRATRCVRLVDAEGTVSLLDYDHLVLATGSRPRPLTVPGAELAGVHRLATRADADRLATAFERARDVVIIGAGFIGLECAAHATARGLAPTVINAAARVLERAASAPFAAQIEAWHEARGVRMLHGTVAREIVGADGAATGVRDSAGRLHPADLVVVGIGAEPVSELAQAAGLVVQGGVLVDALLRTSDPGIFAIGDCARYPHAATGALLRLESVQNATDQARSVAATLTGRPRPYDAAPWFWSDQAELRIQIAGLSAAADEHVLRGDPASGRFSVYCFRDGVLVGVDSLGSAADHIGARKLLAARVSPTPEQAANPSFPLNSLLQLAPVGG
ncbi:NAD(P)/FAD-dependent oxidoreductase [Microterricola viridarii]|uniref:NAD(P)/FAD-dependent oxidoreductase n=1 Tax=Microterricola viridarii TaxID=412690 RepID=UPI0018FFEBCA|nr:FAD-dependent oxidoreductase [Microterricola viridarii]